MAEKTTKAAAARAEKKPKAKKLTWKGLKLDLPAEFPEQVITGFQVDRVLSEDNDPSLPYFRMLKSMLGPEQLLAAKEKLTKEEDVSDLLGAIFEKYGVGLGESKASPAS